MSQRPIEKVSDLRVAATANTRRPRKQWVIAGGALASITILLSAAAWALFSGPKETPPPTATRQAEPPAQTPKPAAVTEKKTEPSAKKPPKKNAKPPVVAKDSAPLWESPTNGQPQNLG